MIRVEFPHWKSEYTLEYIDSPQKAMEFMEAMSDSDEIRNKKYIFLHIEECDMAYVDQERTEKYQIFLAKPITYSSFTQPVSLT